MRGKITTAVMLAIVFVMVFGVVVNAQAIRNVFGWVIADKLTVRGDADIEDDLTVIDQVSAADVTATDDLAVTDDATVGGKLTLSAATSITVTQGATLSPTGAYQPIKAAGNLSFGAITAGTAGDVLTLVNASNTTITITDTSTLKLSGIWRLVNTTAQRC